MYFNFLLDDNPRENKQVVWGAFGAKNNIAIFCFFCFFCFFQYIRELVQYYEYFNLFYRNICVLRYTNIGPSLQEI
jgi:hypothetical protein